jgi:calreticulin
MPRLCTVFFVVYSLVQQGILAQDWVGNADILDEHLTLSQPATTYAVSKPLKHIEGPFIVEYEVKVPEELTCGGSYVKVGHRLKETSFDQDTPYDLMFGSDAQCNGKHTVHALLYSSHRPDINHPLKEPLQAPSPDGEWHSYHFSVDEHNTFLIKIDGETVREGNIEDHFGVLHPKELPDEDAVKPEKWDERRSIPDPDAVKPEDWVEEDEVIDPDATQPDDWEEDDDGEWEPERIPNPEYKGRWRPPFVDNPEYDGIWSPPLLPNPSYVPDPDVSVTRGINYVGIDVWTMTEGIEYRNIQVRNQPSRSLPQ